MKVLVIGNVREEGLNILREFAEVVTLPEPTTSEDIIRHIADSDAILHKIGILGPTELQHQTKLRLIARHGVGLDYLDLDAIRQLGIPVSITNTANSNSVAEATLGLMLNALRRFSQGEAMLKRDRIWARERLMGRELKHQTVGLVGYGRIGDIVGRLLDGFGAEVLVYDVNPAAAQTAGRTVVSFDELLQRSDIISLHCPLSSSTRGMINAEVIAQMKPGVILVNTARGALIDKDALADALRSGQIAGIATDSFDHEPPDFDDAIFSFDNALTTPHLAAMTLDAQIAMATIAAKEIRRVLVDNLPPSNNVCA